MNKSQYKKSLPTASLQISSGSNVARIVSATQKCCWWRWSWLAIVVIASLIRLYQLGRIPVGLYWDEIAMLVDAKAIAQSGQDMHGRPWWQPLFPSYGDYKLPVYIWLASTSVRFFGSQEWVLRLPSALAGIGTVIVAGYIAKQLVAEPYRRITQLSTMLVVALSPWSIMFSRTGFEGHLAQFVVALSVAVGLTTTVRSRWWQQFQWFVVPILGAVATYTYFSVRFVWPVVFIGLVVVQYLTSQTKSLRLSLGQLLVGLGLFAGLLVPMTRSELYPASNLFRYSTTSVLNSVDYPVQSNILRELGGNTLMDRVFFHRHLLLGKELIRNIFDHLSARYLFITGDSNLRHGTGRHGLFLVAFLPFWILGLLRMYRDQPAQWLWLGAWWLVALIPASVPESTPHALRSLNALVPLSIMIGYGLAVGLRRLSLPGVFLVLGVIGASAGEFMYHYATQYPYDSGKDWQAHYREVATRYYQLAKEWRINTSSIQMLDDRFYLWLMVYGPYSATDFRTWQYDHYSLIALPDIELPNNIEPITWQGERLLVLSVRDELELIAPPDKIQHQETLVSPYTPDTYTFTIVAPEP